MPSYPRRPSIPWSLPFKLLHPPRGSISRVLPAQLLHVYCERVHDLLADPTEESIAARLRPLPLREDKRCGVMAVGASSLDCDTAQEAFELLERGELNLGLAARHLNRQPHRGYVVCRVIVEMLPRGRKSGSSGDSASESDEGGDDDEDNDADDMKEPAQEIPSGKVRGRSRAVLTLCELAGIIELASCLLPFPLPFHGPSRCPPLAPYAPRASCAQAPRGFPRRRRRPTAGRRRKRSSRRCSRWGTSSLPFRKVLRTCRFAAQC